MVDHDVDHVVGEVLDVGALVVVVESPGVRLVEHLLKRGIGHRGYELPEGWQRFANLPEDSLMNLGGPKADNDQRVSGLVVVLLRDERRGWRVHPGDHDIDIWRQGGDDVTRQAKHVASLVQAPERQSELNDRTDLVQPELEFGHDAEVAAAAADRPEQIRVLV